MMVKGSEAVLRSPELPSIIFTFRINRKNCTNRPHVLLKQVLRYYETFNVSQNISFRSNLYIYSLFYCVTRNKKIIATIAILLIMRRFNYMQNSELLNYYALFVSPMTRTFEEAIDHAIYSWLRHCGMCCA